MYISENDKTVRGSGRVGGAENMGKRGLYMYVCVDNKHPEKSNKEK